MAAALGMIERAHQIYREGRHEEALGLYSEALAMAKTKPQKIALHSNRAACHLKLQNFKKAAEECTSVLELDHQHAGALMLRAQTLVALKDYQSALFDVNRLMELNPTSEVYRKLQDRLRTQLSLAPIPESEEEAQCLEEEEEETVRKEERKQPPQSEGHLVADPSCSNTSVLNASTRADETRADVHPKAQGWEAIPKPKGHSGLDYSRWDKVEGDSSEDDDDDDVADERKPRYRFRIRNT